jgi:hypothetical protein
MENFSALVVLTSIADIWLPNQRLRYGIDFEELERVFACFLHTCNHHERQGLDQLAFGPLHAVFERFYRLLSPV